MAHGQILKVGAMGVQQLELGGNMRSHILDDHGLPHIVLYENGSAYDTKLGVYLGKPSDSHLITRGGHPNISFTRRKLVGWYFRAPWRNGIKHVNLKMVGCSKYFATEDGRIFGVRNMDYIDPQITHDGYAVVRLYTDNKDYVPWRRGRLIATAFIPNPKNKDTVDHKNKNRQDDRVENLRWMWMRENDAAKDFVLSDDKVAEICRYLEQGMSYVQAAHAADVKEHFVKSILRGSRYEITKNYDIKLYANPSRLPIGVRLGHEVPHGQFRRTHLIISNSSSTTIPEGSRT